MAQKPLLSYTRFMSVIGVHLKQLRETKGLSIRGLAKEVGISHNTLAAYERETVMPSLENGFILAEYFDVPIEFLFKGKTVISDFTDAELLSLFRELDGMDRSDRTVAKKFLRNLIKNRREREGLEASAEKGKLPG